MNTRGWPDGDNIYHQMLWIAEQERQIAEKLGYERPTKRPYRPRSTTQIAREVKTAITVAAERLKACNVCEVELSRGGQKISRHHIVPRSTHSLYPERKGIHKCVWLCRRCHVTTHRMFTNLLLSQMEWTAVREYVRTAVGH